MQLKRQNVEIQSIHSFLPRMVIMHYIETIYYGLSDHTPRLFNSYMLIDLSCSPSAETF